MATKTISIDLDAYDKLVRARSSPTESFSRVIKRAEWETAARNGANLLAVIRKHPPLSEKTLDNLEKAQKRDRPPRNKWK